MYYFTTKNFAYLYSPFRILFDLQIKFTPKRLFVSSEGVCLLTFRVSTN